MIDSHYSTKKELLHTYNTINQILMDYNPLGVEGPALNEEYRQHIPQIMKIMNEREQLLAYLQQLFVKELGIIDHLGKNDKISLEELCNRIAATKPI